MIDDVLVTEGFCLFLSFWNPEKLGTGDSDDRGAYLFYLPEMGDAKPASHRIGEPASIYMFPRVSNLVAYGGKFLVSWAKPENEDSCRLVLTTWEPAKNVASDRSLSSEIDWNTSISMNRIGHDLLIAWHYQGVRDRHCRIRTVHLALD